MTLRQAVPIFANMDAVQPSLAEVAALVGNPARANMLTALLDGGALTATELACAGGVTPQTASGHLARLTEGRLLTCAVTRRRFSSGCKPHPATAPAGSDRSRHGGDE